ncbi:MAG: hypothetical protein IVW52_20960, partial [Acidimicrobiales bacterium]|nr:hypothetical protein [Acidimicrobiales bacterium]
MVLTPVLMLFVLLIVGMTRYEVARQEVIGATRA